MAAPIRKVAPNSWAGLGKVVEQAVEASQLAGGLPPTIQDSLSVFGAVVSSTAPQSLSRCSTARAQIRRTFAVR